MATYYLLNSFLFGSHQRWAGEIVSDTSENVAALKDAGGILWSAGDPNIAHASDLAQSLRRRGGSPGACTALMFAATDYSNGQFLGRTMFGDGDDGLCILDGVRTYNWATLANGTYTLNRDTFLGDGTTILVGVTLDTGSFKLFCTGTFTNYGWLNNDGWSAVANVPGASTRGSGTCGIGMGGGAGGVNAAGAIGGTPAAFNQLNVVNGQYPAGGAGGAGGINGGGAGGTYTGGPYGDGGAEYLLSPMSGMTFNASTNGTQATMDTIGGGAGGGGGGSNIATALGGGGGGGGGVLLFCIQDLVNWGTISANGGHGADGSGTGGAAGGGGGGGGGTILALTRYRSGSGVIVANGGPGGLGIGGGANGVAGGPGIIDLMWA